MTRAILALALIAAPAVAQEPLYEMHVTAMGVTTISEPVERARCYDVALRLMTQGLAVQIRGGVMVLPVVARCVVAGEAL